MQTHPLSRKWIGLAAAALALAALAVIAIPGATAGPGQPPRPESLSFHAKAAGAQSALAYWTPERMRAARPLPMPIPSAAAVEAAAEALEAMDANAANAAAATPAGTDVAAVPPRLKIRPDWTNRLSEPDLSEVAAAAQALADGEEDGVIGQNAGSAKAQFTSSRLVPLSADLVFPYSAVGKLFFSDGQGGDFVCSGSVIRKRIVLTAGHCVHSGDSSPGFYENFMFVPAYRDNGRPFGTWDWQFVIVHSAWSQGGGTFPNAADYAMIETVDRTVGGSLRKIGDVVGTLGFTTSKLFPNHVHILGYPGNHDGGQKMHQVTAGIFNKINPNSVQAGSDMRGGSSGGPWIQNFGAAASGQTGGTNTGINRVVGITSFGPVSTSPLTQGSSIPDSRFTTLVNTACAHRAGNC